MEPEPSGDNGSLIISEITDSQLLIRKDKFVNYSIKTTFPENKVYIVDRRYSEFEWLRRMLIADYPERIIPIIPEKDILGKFEKETMSYRRRTLDNFLHLIVADPEFANNTNVQRFLKDSDQLFETPREKGESIFSSFLTAVNTLANETVTIPVRSLIYD